MAGLLGSVKVKYPLDDTFVALADHADARLLIAPAAFAKSAAYERAFKLAPPTSAPSM
jgi:hypothetical protein